MFPLVCFALPWWLSGKESACQCRRREFDPWARKIPWRWKWKSTPVFLPGKPHGQRGSWRATVHEVIRVGCGLATKTATKSVNRSKVKVAQHCHTLCDPMDYVLQARILEWAAFPFSRGSSQPRDQMYFLQNQDCSLSLALLRWTTQ